MFRIDQIGAPFEKEDEKQISESTTSNLENAKCTVHCA